jgi:hypothetical protein
MSHLPPAADVAQASLSWGMRVPRLFAPLALLTCVSACGPVHGDSTMRVRQLDSPALPGSGEPNLTVAPDGRVLLSWIERAAEKRHLLRYATRVKGGAWSEARTIAEGTDWFVNWADFPSVAALPDGTLFAHWLAKTGPLPYAYDVHIARSGDGGKTWSTPVVPHRDGTRTEHGFVSMTPWTSQAMGVVFLDGRKTAASPDAGHGKGEMALMHTTVGSDGRLGVETVLDGRVCDCCQTDAVRAEGATVVVYRDRSEKEVRDMSVVRFTGGRWSSPRPLSRDGWEIHGCPVNGPAVAASGAKVAVAWFTAAGGTSRVKVALSSDSGASFGPPIVVDGGRPAGRVDVAYVEGDAALVSWIEQGEKGAALLVRRIAADGALGEPLTIADSSAARSSGFPRMASSGNEVTLAWRDAADPPRVRTAVVVPTPARPRSD